MKMAGFCSENSKLKVSLTAKDRKQISPRMSLTEALYAVHTSQLKPMVWYRILRVKIGYSQTPGFIGSVLGLTGPDVRKRIFVIIILIIIALKGAIQDFCYLLTAPANTYAQVVRAHSCANHVQHIECLPHATCCVSY